MPLAYYLYRASKWWMHRHASIKLQGGQRLQAGVKSACEEQEILQVDYVCLY